MANEQIVNAPNLYLDGMQVARASNTTLTVQAGDCRDATNNYDISIASALTLDMAAVGANGIDTGAIGATKLYYIYAIMDISGFNDPAVMASLSTTPVMPYGYGAKRLIGHMYSSAGSVFLAGYWYGDRNQRMWKYDAPRATAVTAGAATSYTAISLANFVPPAENLPVMIAYAFTPGAAARVLNLTPGNATGDAVTITGQVGAVVISGNAEVMSKVTTAVPEVDYKVSNAGDAVAINVAGYSYSF